MKRWKEYIISKLWEMQNQFVIPPPPDPNKYYKRTPSFLKKFDTRYIQAQGLLPSLTESNTNNYYNYNPNEHQTRALVSTANEKMRHRTSVLALNIDAIDQNNRSLSNNNRNYTSYQNRQITTDRIVHNNDSISHESNKNQQEQLKSETESVLEGEYNHNNLKQCVVRLKGDVLYFEEGSKRKSIQRKVPPAAQWKRYAINDKQKQNLNNKPLAMPRSPRSNNNTQNNNVVSSKQSNVSPDDVISSVYGKNHNNNTNNTNNTNNNNTNNKNLNQGIELSNGQGRTRSLSDSGTYNSLSVPSNPSIQ
jgi:hypothetical protein